MADNIELGISGGTSASGENKVEKDDPLPKTSGKKDRIPIAKIENFHFHNQSLRDIQFAIKMTVSFIVGTLIGYTSNYAATLTALDSQWLVPVLATILTAETVGGTVLPSTVAIINFIPELIFLYILQYLGMGYEDYVSSTLFFFLITFIVGFCNPNIAIRKLALILPAIIITTLVTTPREYVSNTFIWNTFGGALIAICVAVAVSLFVLPRFACIEVQDRLTYSVNLSGEIFQLLSLALLSTNAADASDYLCEADSLLDNLKSNQLVINSRVVETLIEPKGLLRKYLRGYQPIYNKLTVREMKDMSSSIVWHLQSAMQAVRQIHFNINHATACARCRDSFQDTYTKYIDLVRLLSIHSSKGPQNEKAIDEAISILLRSCDRTSADMAAGLANADADEKKGNDPENTTTIPADNPSLSIDFDPMASSNHNGMTFSFYLFHVGEMIKLVSNKASSQPLPPEFKPVAPEVVKKPHHSFWTKLKIFFKRHGLEYTITGLRTSLFLGVALVFVEVPYLERKFEQGLWIMIAAINAQNDNVGSTFHQMRMRLLATFFGSVFSYFTFLAVGNTIWINLDLFLPTSTPTMAPINSTLSSLPPASTIKPTGAATLAPIYIDASFDIPQLYTQIGMFVPFLLFCGIIRQNKSWSYFGLLAAITGQIISFGRVSLINYPYEGNQILGGYIVLLRIQENTIGVLIVFLVSCLFMPVLATDSLKINMMNTIVKLTVSVTKSWTVYDHSITGSQNKVNDNVHASGASSPVAEAQEEKATEAAGTKDVSSPNDTVVAVDDIDQSDEIRAIDQIRAQSASLRHLRAECEEIHSNLLEQNSLIDNSELETIFLCKPFSTVIFQHILRVEGTLLTMLFCFDRISSLIEKLVDFKMSSYMVVVAVSLHREFTELTREMYYVFKECHQLAENALFFAPIRFHLPFPEPTSSMPAMDKNEVSIYTETETCDPDELTRLLSVAEEDKVVTPKSPYEYADMPSDRSMSDLDEAQLKAFQMRQDHRQRLRRLHKTISNIAARVSKLNEDMTKTWAVDILNKAGALGLLSNHASAEDVPVTPSDSAAAADKSAKVDASVRRLMTIHTTFFSYFYASSQFASALIEFSNLLFTGTELNSKASHQPF